MGQAFFTLSLGIGAIAIFGSYIGKEHRLAGEALRIGVLDTCVAFVAGPSSKIELTASTIIRASRHIIITLLTRSTPLRSPCAHTSMPTHITTVM